MEFSLLASQSKAYILNTRHLIEKEKQNTTFSYFAEKKVCHTKLGEKLK
jgi:hypothetical protein